MAKKPVIRLAYAFFMASIAGSIPSGIALAVISDLLAWVLPNVSHIDPGLLFEFFASSTLAHLIVFSVLSLAIPFPYLLYVSRSRELIRNDFSRFGLWGVGLFVFIVNFLSFYNLGDFPLFPQNRQGLLFFAMFVPFVVLSYGIGGYLWERTAWALRPMNHSEGLIKASLIM